MENPYGSKSRVLIIGATGLIGNSVAVASVLYGHKTLAMVRPQTLQNPKKCNILRSLESRGVEIFPGSVENSEALVKAVREVDVVICALGGDRIMDQLKIIDAIKQVGTVKRFLPSEFGHDVDRSDPVEPALSLYKQKRAIRRATEAAQINYTYICCNSVAGWPYHDHTQPCNLLPPTHKIQIYGKGDVKAYFVLTEDIGKYTVRAMDDPATMNKKLHFRPPANWVSMNELACIWEKHLGRKLPREELPEQRLLELAKENVLPRSIVAALTVEIFFYGCQNFDVDARDGVEVCSLYPDIQYSTLDSYFKNVLKTHPNL